MATNMVEINVNRVALSANQECKVCHKFSKKYCSDCKLINYCSLKCQKRIGFAINLYV